MQGRFRWKAILILGACLAFVSVGWFFVHRYQKKAIHGRYLDLAAKAEQKGRFDRAARFLQHYLLVKADDADAQALYGGLLEKSGRHKDALKPYEQVLRLDENRNDIRLRTAKICMADKAKLEIALAHLARLKDALPNDPDIEILFGDCKLLKAVNPKNKAMLPSLMGEAEAHFRTAIALAPDRLEPYRNLAGLLASRESRRHLEAGQVLEEFIRANAADFRAYMMRASFRRGLTPSATETLPALGAKTWALMGSAWGAGPLSAAATLLFPKIGMDLEGAGQDLVHARKLAPDDVNVLSESAQHEMMLAREKGRAKPNPHLDQARVHLQRARELHPSDRRILPQLADVELAAGRRKEALSLLQQAQKTATGRERDELLWDVGALLIEVGNLKEADEAIARLKKGQIASSRVNFLRGKLAMGRGLWYDAVGHLEIAYPSLLNDAPNLMMQTDLLLANCFEQLGSTDQQITIYRRARKLEPLNPAPRLGLVRALSGQGRSEEALDECREIRSLPTTFLEVDFLYARLLTLKYLHLPTSAAPPWEAVHDILKGITKKDDSKSAEVDLLRADAIAAEGMRLEAQGTSQESLGKKYEAQGKPTEAKSRFEEAQAKFKEARGKFDEARKILEGSKKNSPENIDPWIALATLAGREGGAKNTAAALKILEEAKAKFPDRPEIRLAILHYVPPMKADALPFLRSLSENLDRFDRLGQINLLAGLGEAFERAGEVSEAKKLWDRLDDRDLRVQFAVLEFQVRSQNIEGVEKALAVIDELERSNGPLSSYGRGQLYLLQAHARLKQAAPGDSPPPITDLARKAREHLLTAKNKRPRWARVQVSLAAVAELEGNAEATLKHLREAFSLGNRQPSLIKSLLTRLNERSLFDEARQILVKLEESEPVTDTGLLMRFAEIASFDDQKSQALELTYRAVPIDSKNYQELLWHGQMLSSLGRRTEAQASLRAAIALTKDDPAPWLFLIQVQVRAGQSTKALSTLEEMKSKLPKKTQALSAAQGYQVIGDLDKAEKAYREALSVPLDDSDNHINTLVNASKFYLNNGKATEAEPHLRRLLDPSVRASGPMEIWARRNLALALGMQKDPDKHTQALGLLEKNLSINRSSVDDLIAKGSLLANKPETRTEAISLLEKAFSVQPPTTDQRFILATLLEANDNWPRARKEMLKIMTARGNQEKYQVYLAAFVDKLRNHDEPAEAAGWLSTLLESIKSDLAQDEAELSSPLQRRFGRSAFLLTELVRRHPPLVAQISAESATLMKAAGNAGAKESNLAAAHFLASCGLLDEALKFCELASKVLPPDKVAYVAVPAVVENDSTPQQLKRVESWVLAAQKLEPKRTDLDANLAILKERQESYAEAELLYRKILKQEPKNIVATNNLAFLLGLQGNSDEAHALIQKLIAEIGPDPELLDSRAVILRGQGKLAEAEKDLAAAMKRERKPYRLFHLAQVQHSARDTQKAKETFDEAVRAGLRLPMLHPLERESYQQLATLKQEKK